MPDNNFDDRTDLKGRLQTRVNSRDTKPRNPFSDNSQQDKPQRPTSGFGRLMGQMFGWDLQGGSRGGATGVTLLDQDPTASEGQSPKGSPRYKPKKSSTEFDRLFKAFLSDAYENTKTLRMRQNRYRDLKFLYENDPYIAMVANLYADEATQMDSNHRVIQIETKSTEMTEDMYSLLAKWQITQNRVRSTCFNLGLYADAFWVLSVHPVKGVTKITPINPTLVKDRIEFDPIAISEYGQSRGWFSALSGKSAQMQALFKAISDADDGTDVASLFERHLFGFQIGDNVLPPWNVVHFRLSPEQSEFSPWGKPLLIHALGPYRMLSAGINLQQIARQMNFPIKIMSVKVDNSANDAAEKFDAVHDTKDQWQNLGDIQSDKEGPSVATEYWIPDGDVNMDVKTPGIDIGSVADIELYQDRVIVASGVPKGYIVQEWGGFGVSALSLTEQHKPFARRTYTIQSAFLEGLDQVYRIHYAITNQFQDTQDYELSMHFPNEESSGDRIQAKQDTINLVRDVFELITGAIGVGSPAELPPEVARDILKRFSFLDASDIDNWITDVRPEEPSAGGGFGGSSGGGSFGGGGGSFGGGGGFGGGDFGGDDAFGGGLGEDDTFAGDTPDLGSDEPPETQESRLRAYLHKKSIMERRKTRVWESAVALYRRKYPATASRMKREAELIERSRNVAPGLILEAKVRHGFREGVSSRRHYLINTPKTETAVWMNVVREWANGIKGLRTRLTESRVSPETAKSALRRAIGPSQIPLADLQEGFAQGSLISLLREERENKQWDKRVEEDFSEMTGEDDLDFLDKSHDTLRAYDEIPY